MPSYRYIDYRLRPGKHVERLMMSEAFGRLKFRDLFDYQYIGMGAVYFSDFLLFHRTLGIQNMVNIERAMHDKARFKDNAPLFIQLEFGDTGTVLPTLDLSIPTIMWLDYDTQLGRTQLNDIRYFAANCNSASVLAMSVQCNPRVKGAVRGRLQMAELETELGGSNVNPKLKDKDLIGEGTARVYYAAIANELIGSLTTRNALSSPRNTMCVEQILYFRYADNAEMMTIAWVFFHEHERHIFQQSYFEKLPYYRNGETAFKIDPPLLTSKEVRTLQSQLPLDGTRKLELGTIPESDAKKYVKLYRYLPNYGTLDWM